MWGVSYWVFPVVSGLCWLGTLLGLLIHWTVGTHKRIYPSMNQGQTIAYISDVGAFELKALFITGAVVTTVFLDLAFLSERWLRHSRRLVPNTTMTEKVLSGLSIAFATGGTVGLISLSILDTYHHPTEHDVFLAVFIGGYIISAVFICVEYQRLGAHNHNHPVLRASFWIKLFFIILEVALAIAFGILSHISKYNAAAVIEWAIAFIFIFYVFSFFIDLLPAVRSKHDRYNDQRTELEAEISPEYGGREKVVQPHGNGVSNGHSHMNGNGPLNGNATSGDAPITASNF